MPSSKQRNHQHYYTQDPTSDISENYFEHDGLAFTSVSGVFGFSNHIDKASQLLIDTFVSLSANSLESTSTRNSILDVGCGFGAIGLSLKYRMPDTNITMTDINNRAVEYARKNAERNNLKVTVTSGDLFEPIEQTKFTDILTNPPIAVGKAFNTRLIHESIDHLSENGNLWLVAFHNKGGSTLKKIMSEVFGNCEDVAKSGGIHVYRSKKAQ